MNRTLPFVKKGFLGSSDGKDTGCSAGDPGSIPVSGRSPGEGNGNPLQYSCLENPMDRPWGHKKLDMTEQLTHSLYLWKMWGKETHTHRHTQTDTHTGIHICLLLWTPNSYVEA